MISYMISNVHDFICLVNDVLFGLLVRCHQYISYEEYFEIIYEIIYSMKSIIYDII